MVVVEVEELVAATIVVAVAAAVAVAGGCDC